MSPRKKTAKKTAKPSPRNGNILPLGAHPGNTGGKPGRSGRRPDEFREILAGIRDVAGLSLLQQILAGELTYTHQGKCPKCGTVGHGPTREERVLPVPSPDTRLRAIELILKHTLPAERTIRLDGFQHAQQVFDLVKERIRAKLGAAPAAELIADIDAHLSQQRAS